MTTHEDPRIYRACLACYNGGNMVGDWFAANDPDSVIAWQESHEAATGHEEYAIHDYDSMVNLGEYPSLEDVAEWAAVVEEHGYQAVAGYVSMVGEHYARPQDFAEAYRGIWRSEQEFAENFAEDVCVFDGVPKNSPARTYFDYEAWTRDLFMADFYSVDTADGVAVFDRNS